MEILSTKKYIEEIIRLKYWNDFLKNTANQIMTVFNANGERLNRNRLLQKIINYNTFVMGLHKLNVFVIFPSEEDLYEHRQHFYDELLYDVKNKNKIDYFDKTIEVFIKNNIIAKESMVIEQEAAIKSIKLIKVEVENKATKDESEVKLIITDKKYPNQFTISKNHYDRLKNMFIGDESFTSDTVVNIDLWIAILLSRYRYYTYIKEGISLSVDVIYDFIKKNHYEKLALEAFAGSLNSNLPKYCSLFYDIERYFGSQGSFLTFDPTKCEYQIIVSNPPYILEVMTRAAKSLINFLNKCPNSTVFVTIPDWRSKSEYEKDLTVHIDVHSKKQKRIDLEYQSYSILRNSPYFKYTFSIGSYRYYNFFKNERKVIDANTLIILLSNFDNSKYLSEFKSFLTDCLHKKTC